MTPLSYSLEQSGHVVEVTLQGPGKGNAMGPDFWRELPLLWEQLDQDESVRCVLLRGAGKGFSTGLDVAAMFESLGPRLAGENLAKERGELRATIERMQRACEGAARCRKPVIAAVHGWCIGGAVNLIAACDVRLASADAKFSLREVKLGITADMGALQRLPRIVGEGNARELALTGKDIDAQRAQAIGLVGHVSPSPEALLEAARVMATEIAAQPPLVVQGIKQVMEATSGRPIEEGLRYVALWNAAFLQSKDLMEAFAAFLEKRPGNYTGE